MKLIRTNTSKLHLSWAADTSNPRALHALLGTVLVAADTARIADDDVLVDTVGSRTTISFTTDSDVLRKPTMAAWNPKLLDEAKTEFLATETVTVCYALHGAATAADLLAALEQIKEEIGGEFTVDPNRILLGRTNDGVTTMAFSISETVPGVELDTLRTSKLATLPQSHTGLEADPIFNPEAGRLVDAAPAVPVLVAADAPKAAPKKACRPAQATVVAVEPAAEPVVESAPTSEPVVVPEPVAVSEPELVAVTEPVPVPVPAITPEPVIDAVEETAAEVTVTPAAPAKPAAILTAVPAQAVTSDLEAPEPTDFDSYPPEIDAPEPSVPEAPDMPYFDVNVLQEPPAEPLGRRSSSSTPPSSTRPGRPKTFSPPVIVTGANGRIALSEDDIF